MNLSDIIQRSFDLNIGSTIPGLSLDDLIYIKFPGTLNYIDVQTDNCGGKSSDNIKLRNHPRIRELEGIVFYNTTISQLDYGSYNYAIFKDTFTNKFHIVFGKVTFKSELGVKHSIISKGFPIYLAGELKKTKSHRDIDIIQFNFNSSNFKIRKLRETAYRILRPTNPSLICEYWLNVHNISGLQPDQINLFEDAYHKFYHDFIRTFAETIFKNNIVSGYPDDSKFVLEYEMSEQDTYSIYDNPIYVRGLHDYYDKPKNETCYRIGDPEFLERVNQKGQSEQISRMCNSKYLSTREEPDCEQDTPENKIDVLDEVFLQMIYQKANILDNQQYYWFYDNDYLRSIISIIDDANLNIFRYNFKLIDSVEKYFKFWLYRYITKNYPNIFIGNFISNNYFIPRNAIPVHTIPEDQKFKLGQLYILIKIFLYVLFRIRIDVDLDECDFYKIDEQRVIDISIIFNQEQINFNISTNYLFDIPAKYIYYDKANTKMIFDITPITLTDAIIKAKSFGNFTIGSLQIITNLYNLDDLIHILPIPIQYLSLQKKYLKYKAKYLQLKKLKNYIN